MPVVKPGAGEPAGNEDALPMYPEGSSCKQGYILDEKGDGKKSYFFPVDFTYLANALLIFLLNVEINNDGPVLCLL